MSTLSHTSVDALRTFLERVNKDILPRRQGRCCFPDCQTCKKSNLTDPDYRSPSKIRPKAQTLLRMLYKDGNFTEILNRSEELERILRASSCSDCAPKLDALFNFKNDDVDEADDDLNTSRTTTVYHMPASQDDSISPEVSEEATTNSEQVVAISAAVESLQIRPARSSTPINTLEAGVETHSTSTSDSASDATTDSSTEGNSLAAPILPTESEEAGSSEAATQSSENSTHHPTTESEEHTGWQQRSCSPDGQPIKRLSKDDGEHADRRIGSRRPESDQRFEPFSCEKGEAEHCNVLMKPLGPRDKSKGVVYLAIDQADPTCKGYVKIGVTGRGEERYQDDRTCDRWLNMRYFWPSCSEYFAAHRLEAFLKAVFHKRRRRLRNCSYCKKRSPDGHNEWFKIDVAEVMNKLEDWQPHFIRNEIYNSETGTVQEEFRTFIGSCLSPESLTKRLREFKNITEMPRVLDTAEAAQMMSSARQIPRAAKSQPRRPRSMTPERRACTETTPCPDRRCKTPEPSPDTEHDDSGVLTINDEDHDSGNEDVNDNDAFYTPRVSYDVTRRLLALDKGKSSVVVSEVTIIEDREPVVKVHDLSTSRSISTENSVERRQDVAQVSTAPIGRRWYQFFW